MKNFNVHRSSVSRYMTRSSSYSRSSLGRRNSYKLGNNTFKSYLQEAQQLADEITSAKEEESTTSKNKTLSKYSGAKATTYKNTTSKFNSGYDAIADSIDAMEKELAKESPDMDKAFSATEKFVDGYNDLVAAVKASSNRSVSSKGTYFTDMAAIYTRTLEKIGVTSDKNGVLSIDKEKFQKADIDDIKNVVSKKSSLASHVEEQADNIKLMSTLSADTYSTSTNKYGSSYANGFTSAMSGYLFNSKL